MLQQLDGNILWDVVIIGGGATGLGAAVDAASRGYKTLLVEQFDFAKGTSSRSTKLVHGGVRYLAQGNIKLVMDALRERGILLKNAPHVAHDYSFIIPAYKWWEKMYYGFGLKIYDLMAGKLSLGDTKIISKNKAILAMPTIEQKKLTGGIVYHDGQFDDTRLAINLAQTAAEQNACVLNYCQMISFLKKDEQIIGIQIKDSLNGKVYDAKGKVIINATGVFTDSILKMDNPLQPNLVAASQGIHFVLDKKFFPGDVALMVPKTADGRVLFAVPWHDKVVVGTTDTPVGEISYEPKALDEEIDFILTHINLYLSANISKADVLSVYVGLRPLVKNTHTKKTSLLPRDHTIIVSKTNLITITGGKWTTYRKMAKDVIEKAIKAGDLPKKECTTETLRIHGFTENIHKDNALSYYGSDAALIDELYASDKTMRTLLHPTLPYTKAMVILAVRNEMAQTVEDVLARRTRALFLDAQAAMLAATEVAAIMAKEMNKDEAWQKDQINEFTTLAKGYLLNQ